jgi:hypothetical protein
MVKKMSFKDSLKKGLNILTDYISIILLVSGALIIIGTLLTFSIATIDIIVSRLEIAISPLFGKIVAKAYEDLPGLFSLLYSSLFSGAIPTSFTVLSYIILALGGIIAIFGILELLKEKVGFLEFLKEKSIVIIIIYLVLGAAVILLSLIEYFVFRGPFVDGIQSLYLLIKLFTGISQIGLLGIIIVDPVTLPAVGFYLIAIPPLAVVVVSIILLIISGRKAAPAPRRTTTSTTTST